MRRQLERLYEEIHPPLGEQRAVIEAARCLECGGPYALAPCMEACPTKIEIPKFIGEIREGRPLDAARTIFEANVLGGSCARVCPVEVLCEGACVLKREGRRAVEIGRLQRYATDYAIQRKHHVLASEGAPRREASVGVIGAGPAGLSCAAELAKLGYAVVVYERRERPGGLITYGIAPYKQQYEPLLQEVEAVQNLGVEFCFGMTVGEDVPFEELERRHDAIFLGLGLGGDVRLDIEGRDLEGIWDSLEFIEVLKAGDVERLKLGRRVAVIGGGNTAIDVAREAVRLGARDVKVLYRRTESEMPAYAHEVEAAKGEGVEFLWLTAPVRFLGDWQVEGVECVRMKLTAKDPSGRPKPEPVPGTEFTVAADTVIVAIGQRSWEEALKSWGLELEWGLVKVNEDYQTSHENIFAGGDCINGGGTVVEAVQHGKLAAQAIHRHLSSQNVKTEQREAPVEVRREGPITRYYQGDCFVAVRRDFCKGCALCVHSCPEGILELDRKGKIVVKDVGECVFCGLCELRCPDFAIWIEKSLIGERREEPAGVQG